MKNDKIDIILSDNNLGYSYAINLGIKHIESITDEANIFISNSDIIIKSEKDLEILEQYDVRATFFFTGTERTFSMVSTAPKVSI